MAQQVYKQFSHDKKYHSYLLDNFQSFFLSFFMAVFHKLSSLFSSLMFKISNTCYAVDLLQFPKKETQYTDSVTRSRAARGAVREVIDLYNLYSYGQCIFPQYLEYIDFFMVLYG